MNVHLRLFILLIIRIAHFLHDFANYTFDVRYEFLLQRILRLNGYGLVGIFLTGQSLLFLF